MSKSSSTTAASKSGKIAKILQIALICMIVVSGAFLFYSLNELDKAINSVSSATDK